jgi:hypothetical protein
MLNLENNLQNNEEKETTLESKVEEVNLPELVEKKTEDLNSLISSSSEVEIGLGDNTDLEVINNEEKEELVDWQETSEAIINNDLDKAKESWKNEAEERFNIKDFNLETFKRISFDADAVADNFAAGRDWDYIYNNIDNFVVGCSYETANKSFEIMQSLEDKLPGSVKTLHEKFGITNFQRYPEEILINQLNEGVSDKNIGLLSFAVDDWNGAFDNQSKIWSKVYDNQKDNLDFKIIECDSNMDLARQLVGLKQSANQKVALAFLSAHSSKESFSLGGENSITQEDIKRNSASLKDIFSDEAQIVANACSSAAVGGWVNTLSKEVRIKAVGPEIPAAIVDVDFVGNEVVPIYHDNDLSAKNYHNGFLISK